ncbi:HTH 37 and/or MarR 2 domain containing protein, partial [Asbolus verrucosus]
DNEIRINEVIDNNSQVSQRQISRQTEISQSSVSRILRESKFHPYHVTLVQEPREGDYERRVRFCKCVQDKINHNEDFLKFVMLSNEAKFCSNSAVNYHNYHYYTLEDPH